MVGISDLFSGASFAQNLVRTNAAVSRPNFELQFNILQNTIIDRLNEKIAEVTADDGLQNDKIDVFLLQSAKKLTSFQQGIEKFIFENTGNANGVSSISERLDQLDAALDAGDTDAFNTALGKVNETTGLLTVTDGSTVGIFSNDGIQKLRNSGVVRFDNGGTTTKATSLSDFADTAAFISAMDLIISVDTAAVHLAGALGTPTWVMLSFVPDWRWQLTRTDSPWYGCLRLFRQSEPGNWRGVINDIRRALPH